MSDSQTRPYLSALLDGLTDVDLRVLRAIINGKLGKRKITPEQQARMQAARKKSKLDDRQ